MMMMFISQSLKLYILLLLLNTVSARLVERFKRQGDDTSAPKPVDTSNLFSKEDMPVNQQGQSVQNTDQKLSDDPKANNYVQVEQYSKSQAPSQSQVQDTNQAPPPLPQNPQQQQILPPTAQNPPSQNQQVPPAENQHYQNQQSDNQQPSNTQNDQPPNQNTLTQKVVPQASNPNPENVQQTGQVPPQTAQNVPEEKKPQQPSGNVYTSSDLTSRTDQKSSYQIPETAQAQVPSLSNASKNLTSESKEGVKDVMTEDMKLSKDSYKELDAIVKGGNATEKDKDAALGAPLTKDNQPAVEGTNQLSPQTQTGNVPQQQPQQGTPQVGQTGGQSTNQQIPSPQQQPTTGVKVSNTTGISGGGSQLPNNSVLPEANKPTTGDQQQPPPPETQPVQPVDQNINPETQPVDQNINPETWVQEQEHDPDKSPEVEEVEDSLISKEEQGSSDEPLQPQAPPAPYNGPTGQEPPPDVPEGQAQPQDPDTLPDLQKLESEEHMAMGDERNADLDDGDYDDDAQEQGGTDTDKDGYDGRAGDYMDDSDDAKYDDDMTPYDETSDEVGYQKPGGEIGGDQKTGFEGGSRPLSGTQPAASKPHIDVSQSSSTHFMTYLVTFAVLVAVLYILYHNKQKVMGLMIEGRRSRSNSSSLRYKRLNQQGSDEELGRKKGGAVIY